MADGGFRPYIRSHIVYRASLLYVIMTIFYYVTLLFVITTRPEHFSGRAEKISVISGRKNLAYDHPTGRIGPQFLGRARSGPGLGRAARAFYSVKQLKTTFRAGLEPKFFSRASRLSVRNVVPTLTCNER
jgi:hypothetical protein